MLSRVTLVSVRFMHDTEAAAAASSTSTASTTIRSDDVLVGAESGGGDEDGDDDEEAEETTTRALSLAVVSNFSIDCATCGTRSTQRVETPIAKFSEAYTVQCGCVRGENGDDFKRLKSEQTFGGKKAARPFGRIVFGGDGESQHVVELEPHNRVTTSARRLLNNQYLSHFTSFEHAVDGVVVVDGRKAERLTLRSPVEDVYMSNQLSFVWCPETATAAAAEATAHVEFVGVVLAFQ